MALVRHGARDMTTCSDANLVRGFLNEGFFAGGEIRLDRKAAEAVIEQVNTTIIVPAGYNLRCDAYGSFEMTAGRL